MRPVDHRFTLSTPALPSAPSKKIVLQRQLPNLCVQRLHVHRRLGPPGPAVEHVRHPFEKLRCPLRDLVRMHVEVLRQVRERQIPLHGGQRHLRLEGRCVAPPGSSGHGPLLSGRHPRRRQADTPLIPLSRFPEPALSGGRAWHVQFAGCLRRPSPASPCPRANRRNRNSRTRKFTDLIFEWKRVASR